MPCISVTKIAAVAAVLSAMIAPAYAYIDPGMGSLALQALIGAVAGGVFAARMWWARIVSFLPGARKKPSTDADAASDKTPS